MGTKGKNDADAKYLKRVLAALDQWRQQARWQNWRARRQKPGDDNSESHEMHNAVRREIGLVVRIERFQNPAGQNIAEVGCVNCHRHPEGKDEISDGEPERSSRANDRLNGLGPAKGDPGAQEKQQLPGERVEIPNSRRRGGKIPAKKPSG